MRYPKNLRNIQRFKNISTADKWETILSFAKVILESRRQIYSGQAETMVSGIHNTEKRIRTSIPVGLKKDS